MRKLFLLFLLVGLSGLAQTKEKREVGDFDAIKVSQGIVVDFSIGNSKSVEVDVEDSEDLQYVKTEVDNQGVLNIYIENSKVSSSSDRKGKKFKIFNNVISIRKVHVKVSNPTLVAAYASSSGKINLENEIKTKVFTITSSSSAKVQAKSVQCDNLTITSSSSADVEGVFQVTDASSLKATSSANIEAIVHTKQMEVSCSSSADILLTGHAKETQASVSSSGSIKALDFETDDLQGKASSSGSMRFLVNQKVFGRASSSGSISYKGQASIVESNTSSSGSVKKIQ